MSLLFSHVTVKINDCTVRFFACGIPKEVSDLENYTAYNQFIEDICKNTEVNVHTDAYLYGDGDLNIATPTEIAYFTIRHGDDPTFLDRCKKLSSNDFCFTYRPNMYFGQDFIQM